MARMSEKGPRITFYGGMNEIGGNKFLLEDKGTRIFLDFGMQMGLHGRYLRHDDAAKKAQLACRPIRVRAAA